MGENDKAFDSYNQAFDLERMNNAPPLKIAIMLFSLGETLRELKRWDEAELLFQEALRLREQVSYQVGDPTQLGAFQDTLHRFYERYARLKMEENRPEEALEMLDRGRGQGLARQIDLSERKDITRFFTEEERRNLMEKTNNHHTALANQRSLALKAETIPQEQKAAWNERLQKAEQKVQQAQQEYELLLAALFARHPDLRDSANNRPARFERLKTLIQDNPDTLYLEYGFVNIHTPLLFTLGKQEGFKAFHLAIERKQLWEAIQNWQEALQRYGGRGVKRVTPDVRQQAVEEERKLAHQVYELLLGEVEKAGLLANGRYKHLVFVGNNELLEISIAALVDGQGKRKDDALRSAMLSVLQDGNPKHASPYFWAAFELIGDASPLAK